MSNEQLVPEILRVEVGSRINFAMLENDVPVVHSLNLENDTQEDLSGLRVRIVAEPEFGQPWERRVDLLRAGTGLELPARDFCLSPGFLGQLTERTRGFLHFELHQGDELLQRVSKPVDLLARDEWSGLQSLPEILAAFVQPNHPAVAEVLSRAAQVLGRWSGETALDGYARSEPKRVFTTAAAIYVAIQNLDLSYITPPASFELDGQRVRMPDRILDSGMGTCLDLALLTAACLEQAGLHALLVVVRGHAFVGVWLREESFGEAVTHEPLRLRKRVDLNEILIFDPTFVTSRPLVDFDRARTEARSRLEDVQRFECVIDIHRARKGNIRPLPSAVQASPAPEASAAQVSEGAGAPAPDLEQFEIHSEYFGELGSTKEEGEATPATRLDRWQRRLLDLSLRNRLINFRESKKTIPIQCPDLQALEDALADGQEFALRPQPHEWQSQDPRDAEAQRERLGEGVLDGLLREELASNRLRSGLSESELQRRALETFRAARLGKEEGGTSGLYLALGFLAWHAEGGAGGRHLAPILLLPIELKRKTVRSGFTLLAGEDEPRVNVSLLELLSKEYGLVPQGLDPLPEKNGSLDVQRIFQALREAVRDMDRWDVVTECQLGLFSFAKFLMWRDLNERAGELMQSPVVKHLVERPGEDFEPEQVFPDASRLDEERALVDTFCPLAADSSQLAAVFAAADGRSFVLEGPPGTGKSQTITNLIAQCLAEKKSVLFISEKMAALSVVFQRLQKIGLGRFCLELHSNKATKRVFYEQLDQAMQVIEPEVGRDWASECARLEGLRSQLNDYVRALHQPRVAGESAFEVLSRLIALGEVERVPLGFAQLADVDSARLAALRESVDRLANVANSVGDPEHNPWRAANASQWTPSFEDQVLAQVAELQTALEDFEACLEPILKPLGLKLVELDWDGLQLVDELCALLAEIPGATAALLLAADPEAARQRLLECALRGRVRDGLRQRLYGIWTPALLKESLDTLSSRWRQAQASFFPLGWWKRRALRRELRPFTKSGQLPAVDALAADLETATQLQAEEAALEDQAAECERLLGRHWKQGDADWNQVERIVRWTESLWSLVARLAGSDLDRAVELKTSWSRLATEGRALLAEGAELAENLSAFRASGVRLGERCQETEVLLELDAGWREPPATEGLAAKAPLDALRITLEAWRTGSASLRPWCYWKQTAKQVASEGLQVLLDAFEAGQVPAAQLAQAFERGYAEWAYRAILDQEPLLSNFFSQEHERAIARFAALDDELMELSSRMIIAKLAERMPRPGHHELPGSEVGILKREIAKRARHMSVRRAFERLPNLIPRLKPCLLMSPLSVAQYLDAGYQKFDLVVFDEASQIPVWDAVGAIARGSQAVIVGDPKQLPPTNFFQKQEDEDFESDPDGEEQLVEDLESILDDCLGAGLKTLHLDWHYRSRHESLIAFSNAHYYQNRLLTFPSPADGGMGVRWRHVAQGHYDKGKTRTNSVEAKAVVDEIQRRLADPIERQHSIGVVTFNQAQQILVEDLLEAMRGAHPELEGAFGDEAHEQVFVKNLENVQGDERDVILFSIGYGPDESGRVSMNFGPMNREGGERRLNVAITRARREVIVFSTLRADQIDLARTRAQGVHDLKRFLAYAERGMLALGTPQEAQAQPGALPALGFEASLQAALEARGWELETQVGCSGYRIDLAVRDGQHPDRYLMGIECDGSNYRRANTARDRDKSRAAVLRGLGWQLCRVWSNDWWANPEAELERLVALLEAAQQAGASVAAAVEGSERVRELPAAPEVPSLGEPQVEQAGPSTQAASEGASLAEGPQSMATPTLEEVPAEARATPTTAEPSGWGPRPYQVLKRGRRGGRPESFLEARSTASIQAALVAVVELEGPIEKRLLCRRVASFWRIERFTAKVNERATEVFEVTLQETGMQLDAQGFVWPHGLDRQAWEGFRVPSEAGQPEREVEELPPQEIAAAALYLLQQNISVPRDELLRQTARLFGYGRIGSRMQEHLATGIERLREHPDVEWEGARLVLK